MEIGTSSNDVAWEPTPGNGFDAEMLGWYRTYTRLHLRLWPYEWTYAERLKSDGRAIERALGLAYPELGENPSDEYLFGDSLLVCWHQGRELPHCQDPAGHADRQQDKHPPRTRSECQHDAAPKQHFRKQNACRVDRVPESTQCAALAATSG